mgnify:CR=1 FL=1|jgi:hypothetical protein
MPTQVKSRHSTVNSPKPMPGATVPLPLSPGALSSPSNPKNGQQK